MPSSYTERLHKAINDKKTAALVGLDPRFDLLPEEIKSKSNSNAEAFEEFCKRLIDVVAPLVPAVKPQAAFFEEQGPAGMVALGNVISYAREQGLIVICDAKRGDIGSTAEAYARAYLAGEDPNAANWAANALTINPYLGVDTLQPFVDVAHERGAGLYVLVRTSNPGAGTFQDRKTDGQTLFETVADEVEKLSQKTLDENTQYGCVGAVIGATYPQELSELRERMPHVPLLIPGYGAQGGGAAEVVSAFDKNGFGALINSSRGINFAYNKENYKEQFSPDQWEQAIEAATHEMIKDLSICNTVSN